MSGRFANLVDPFVAYAARTPSAKPFRFIFDNLKPFRWVIAGSLILTVLGAALEVWLIGYTSQLVDILATTGPETLWAEYGTEFLIVALVVLIGRPLAGYLRESLDDIAFRPNAEALIAWRAHRHVTRQSVGWFRNDLSGRIANQVWAIGGSAVGVAYSVIHTLAYVTIYVVGAVGLMASIDLRLALPLLVWAAAYLGFMAYIVPRVQKKSSQVQDAYSRLTGLLVDSYANIDILKLFANAEAEDIEARNRFKAMRDGFVRMQTLEVMVNSTMLFLASALIVGLVGYTLVLWQSGEAPIGLVAAALALSFRITGMAEWMLDAVSAFFGYLGYLSETLKTVGQPLAIVDAPDAAELRIAGGAIAFRDVTHRYGKDDGGLDAVTLTIAPGEKVGLVGRSGAGKSTLVNLLLRFFEAEQGVIEIDGQQIKAVTQESLRRHIAMVGQDASLLHRSVRDNIAYGRPDVTQAEIDAAAKAAQADAFIPGLADQEGRTGYDAHVGERGVKLSGGQRQRVAIARAILKDAPILVLDEATSALDSEVEAAIQDTLYGVMEGKTVIAIAHRLSTIARMDRIVVLDKGRVVEAGPHAELLARGGIYARLWEHQSGGFLGTED